MIKRRYKSDLEAKGKQSSGKEFICLRIAYAYYKGLHNFIKTKSPVDFIVLKYNASSSYSATLANKLLNTGVLSAYPRFVVNVDIIKELYPFFFLDDKTGTPTINPKIEKVSVISPTVPIDGSPSNGEKEKQTTKGEKSREVWFLQVKVKKNGFLRGMSPTSLWKIPQFWGSQ